MCLPRAVLLASVMAWSASGQTFTISTLAGSGPPKIPNNVPGTSASLNEPNSVAVDGNGNLFFTDQNTVFRLDAVTGVLTIAAGNGTVGSGGDNSPATSAQLSMPSGIAVDSAGNLYIADSGHYRIRKVSNGVITTVAGNGTDGFSGDGGPATRARLSHPAGVAVDPAGNLYITDTANSRVRKVSRGVITTVAGNGTDGFSGDGGPATSAQLFRPNGLAVDSAGKIYIADEVSHRIREISNGVITTVAGNGTPGFSGDNGPAATAQLYWPNGLAVDSAGKIYVADGANERIRLLTPASSSCSASVTPTTLSSRASGGNLIVSIKTTSASCAWAVQSLPGWITNSGNVVGTGSASVDLVVAKNPGASRRATVSIAGIPVTITQ
jgi:sugar lactone lactonase YvrE